MSNNSNTIRQNLSVIMSVDTATLQRDIQAAEALVRSLERQVNSSSGQIQQALNQQLTAARANLQQLQSQSGSVNSAFQSMGDSAERLGRKLAVAGAAFTALTANAVMDASDVEEALSKFNNVFGSSSREMNNFITTFAKASNRSVYDLRSMAAEIQDTLVPLGFARDEAQKMSEQILQLSVDEGSFDNRDMKEVLRDITSGLVGNTEGLRKYGVILTETNLKEKQLKYALDETSATYGLLYNEMNQTQKAQLILQATIDGLADAQGDAIETAESFANQLEGMKASLKDASVTLGKDFQPIALQMVKTVKGLAESFANMSTTERAVVESIGVLTTASGALLLSLGAILKIWPALTASMTAFKTGLTNVSNSLGLSVGQFTAATAAMGAMLIMMQKTKMETAEYENALKRIQALDTSDENKRKENYLAEEQTLRDLAERYNELQQVMANYGVHANSTYNKNFVATDFVRTDTTKLTKEQKEEVRLLQGRYSDLAEEIRESYGTFENFQSVLRETNKYLREEAEAAQEAARNTEAAQQILNNSAQEVKAIEELNKARRDELQTAQDTFQAAVDQKNTVTELIAAYDNLVQKTNRTAEEELVLAALMERINSLTGQQIITQNTNTNTFSKSTEALATYNANLQQTIALAQEDITIRIKTVVDAKTSENDLNYYELEKEYLETHKEELIKNGKYTVETLEAEKQMYQNRIDALKSEATQNEDAIKSAQNALDNYLKSVSSSYSPKTAKTSSTKDANTVLKEKIQEENAAIKHQYDLNKIDNQEYLDKLKSQYQKYTAFYKKNASERRQIEKEIYDLEENITNTYKSDRLEYLDKAQEKILERLDKERELLEDNYNQQVKQIKDASQTRIDSIQKEIDKKKEALELEREEEDLAKIEQELEIYKHSTTAEAMQYYAELVRKKEDILLSRDERVAEETITSIENIRDAALEAAENQYDLNVERLEAQTLAVEEQYKKMTDIIQDVSEDQTNKMNQIVEKYVSYFEVAMSRVESAGKKVNSLLETVNVADLNNVAASNAALHTAQNTVNITNNITVNANSVQDAAQDVATQFMEILQTQALNAL